MAHTCAISPLFPPKVNLFRMGVNIKGSSQYKPRSTHRNYERFSMKGQHADYFGLLLLYCIATVNATTPLWLLFVSSRCDGERFESSSVLPAAEMAVERISSNPSLLPGYSLNLTVTRQVRCTIIIAYI